MVTESFRPTHRLKEDAEYYVDGPQQGRSADGTWSAGTLVRLLDESGSYTLVLTEEGGKAYISTGSLEEITLPPKVATLRQEKLDAATLDIGGTLVRYVKSDKYIAIKPRLELNRSTISELAPLLASATPEKSLLGGFQLVNVDDVNESAEDTLDALRENAAVVSGSHVFHTSDDEVPFVPTGQIYVECKPDAAMEECQDLLDQLHLEIVEARGEREMLVQVTPQSANPVKTALALQQSPLIAVAEPDMATPGQIHGFSVPADGRLLDQWHLKNIGFHRGTTLGFKVGADARVVAAWELRQTIGSPNVVVAVIDDGFDLAHPDLSGDWKIVAPKDFTRNTASPLPDPLSEDWHGTACAGVALGNADGTGIVGAAPRCRLMPIRWGADLSDRQLENWFGYAREQGAWVVSCSWGALARNFPLSHRTRKAISQCAQEGRDGLGTVICFAAGNENRDVNDPARSSVNGFAIHPDVIAVAASNSRDRRSSYSNFGDAISVCAPSSGAGGWGITTSDVMGQYQRGNQTFEAGYSVGAYTNDFGGTSSACPLVAGVCGLILSAHPTLRADQVRELIERTARKIGPASDYDANGHSRNFGYGCVDAAAALTAAQEGAPNGDIIAPFFGQKGHRLINKLSIAAVPSELRPLYELSLDDVVAQAMAADDAKTNDPAEAPRHFIDLDLYGAPPFSELPENFDAAREKFGEATVIGRGIVPWQIEKTYLLLVEAFRAGKADDVVEHSAWLGHYVADSHVPFHTTANHDGQLTGQKGLHSYFEAQLLNKHVSPQEISPAPGGQITGAVNQLSAHRLAFQWVRESYGFLKTLLDADAANGGKIKKRNLKGFAQIAKPIAIERIEKGCTRTASLWYSAWLEAGKPDISGFVNG